MLSKKNIKIVLLLIAITWGLGISVTQHILNQGMNSTSFIFYRFITAFMILSIVYWSKVKLNKQNIVYGFISGILLFLFFILQTVGLDYTTVSKTAIYTGTTALITPFLAFIFLKSKLNKLDIIAAIILISAIVTINNFSLNNFNQGDVLVLLSTLFLSLNIIFLSKITTKENFISITIFMLFTTALLGFVTSLFTVGLTPIGIAFELKYSILFLSVVTTALAFYVQNRALQLTTEAQISLILATESIWGILFGIILFKEVLSLNILIGIILMSIAIIISKTR